MSKYFLKYLLLMYATIAYSAPVDHNNEDKPDLWHEMFTLRFSDPTEWILKRGDSFEDYNIQNEYMDAAQDENAEEVPDIYPSSFEKGIFDFGVSYGHYPIELASFTQGIKTN